MKIYLFLFAAFLIPATWFSVASGEKISGEKTITDSVEGTYVQYHIKYGDMRYFEESGIETFDPLPFPDTQSVHTLRILPGNKFLESIDVYNPSVYTRGAYTERTGSWSRNGDTLLLVHETESIYTGRDKKDCLETGPVVPGNSYTYTFIHTWIYVDGIKLVEVSTTYSQLCLLKK